MTALNTFLLTLGMAVIGVPVLLGLLSPLVGAVVVRLFPESAWDDIMLLFAQGGAAAATFLVGFFAVGLPWVACLIAAVLVGITSYARRAPEPLDEGFYSMPDYSTEESVFESRYVGLQERDRDRAVEFCPECGKRCRGEQALAQHMKAKHPDAR